MDVRSKTSWAGPVMSDLMDFGIILVDAIKNW
jgi:hypothetical protein